MPAAVRQSERRPSAPMTRRAATRSPLSSERHAGVVGLDRAGFVFDPRAAKASCPRAGVERGKQMPVLDVVAEGVEPDLGRGEANLRRAHEPRGRIDDPHDPERRCMRVATRPDAERLQSGDGARQQRGGAMIGTRRGGAISAVSMPASANAMAAVSPAGPPPTIATSTVNGFAMVFSASCLRFLTRLWRSRRGAGNHDPGCHFRMYRQCAIVLPVTDFAHEHSLTHLSASETRLSAALSQPRRIALRLHCGADSARLARARADRGLAAELAGAVPPGGVDGWGELGLIAPMWMAMTLAMMLPTAGPMILTYAEIADTAARKREPVVSPLVLTAGYVAVWLGFALAAASLQWALARAGLLDGGSVGRLVGGTIFLGAGLYQFSALKQACLTLCQRPFPFFFSNWTTEPSGVLRLGLRQGMLCLGCCWAMMLADVRGRRDERGVDGGAGRADDDREARPRRRGSARRVGLAFRRGRASA